MFNKSIKDMNSQELREFVQYLYDAFERQRREYTDLLQNLDFDNFTPEVSKAIKSTVSDEKLGEIAETVIEQTADAISTYAARQVDIKNATEVKSTNEMKDTSKVYKICTYKEDESGNDVAVSSTYYYYNTLSKGWEAMSGDTIYTLFEQTQYGFEFKGNVVVGGTLKGVKLEGATVTASGSATGTDITLRTSDNGMNGEIYMGTGLLHPYVDANGQGGVKLDTASNDFDLKCGTFNIKADKIEGLGLPLVFS